MAAMDIKIETVDIKIETVDSKISVDDTKTTNPDGPESDDKKVNDVGLKGVCSAIHRNSTSIKDQQEN